MRGAAALLAAALLATGCAQNPEPAREPVTTASAADVERAVPASDKPAVRPEPPEPQPSEPERPDPQAPDPADGDASTETHETDAPGPDQAGPGGSHDPDHDGPVDTHAAGAASSWTVQYTAEGLFVPVRLDIATGDEVVFMNSSDVPVWPASNIHPTHEILSSFDPQEVIRPGESWAYQFTENGYWRYHNHLEPSEVGLVVATGAPAEDLEPLVLAVEQLDFERPSADAGGEALFDEFGALADFVRAYGPAAAVAELKAVELETGRWCHDAAHEAGRVAFDEFGPVAFAIAGHDCQAGAMHGATEALFASRGTTRLAADVAAVCSAAANPFLLHQCLHGVGHGLMAWTTYEIHEALELCDVLPAPPDQQSCWSGVFMENVVGGLSGVMGHETQYLRPDDPHFPCDVVEARYLAECYFFQTSHMLRVFDGDFASVASECGTLPERPRELCFGSYGRDVGSATRGDPALAVQLCEFAAAGRDRTECVRGAVQDRFWETTGADEAIAMCVLVDGGGSPDAAEACWATIIARAGNVFGDAAGRESFCARLPQDRRSSCRARLL